jgi:hypothetical protein
MPPRPAPRRPLPPRKKIIWLRAMPIFAGMMTVLLLGQLFLLQIPVVRDSPIGANGGLGLSLIAGIGGAFLISRFATETPPPPPSKSQQRKQAAAARAKDRAEAEEEEAEPVAVGRSASAQRRRRRRR